MQNKFTGLSMSYKNIALLLLVSTLAAGCSFSPAAPTPLPTEVPTQTPIPPTATPLPSELTICLGAEPESLFLYNGSFNASMLSVLEAVYDGPIDYVNYSYQPVILKSIPSLETGDAALTPVELQEGMDLVDADGNLATLHAGVRYLPAGCSSADCAQTYDGKAPVSVDQLHARFSLLPGLTWSDGQPLTAADSVFSYSLAASPALPTSKGLIQRTASYTALDDLTVEWVGLPGYRDAAFANRFWLPLPQHLLGEKDPASLLTDPQAMQQPIGWGPYVISEWVRGDHITATRNPAYFRAAEGLPVTDIITFRFTGTDAQTNIQALLSGECDLLDASTGLESQAVSLAAAAKSGQIQLLAGPSPYIEMLSLNVKPASHDNGYQANQGDQPGIFGDARVRQAAQLCLDTSALNTALLGRLSSTPASFLPVGDPLTSPALQTPAYDPAAGTALLDAAGWKDHDNNPATPRIAYSVANVPAGTPLQVDLAATNTGLRMAAGEMIASNLQACGFGVQQVYMPAEQLFAPGPDGQIFGRTFDMASFYWGGLTSACQIYETAQTPTAKNNWIGANITGYSSADFDAACASARYSLPGQPGYGEALNQAQQIFSTDLPAIPLYQPLRVAAARPDVCNFQLDATSRSLFWQIEQIHTGSSCP
jgi:peptide/nickel transport system substrate-binding protein